MSSRPRRLGAACTLAALALLACGDDDDAAPATTTIVEGTTSTASPSTTTTTTDGTTTPPPGGAAPLTILVTNDDGYEAQGIDTLVEALRAEPDVIVIVVAPATDQSGTGGQVTTGPLDTSEVATRSGYAATAVAGFPADTIAAALDQLGLEPDLVMSGSNAGQNIGPLTEVSGTVGAARAAARRGIPALAISQGLAAQPDYPTGVALAIDWLRDNRAEIADGGDDGDPVLLTSLNVPSCPAGVRGVVELPAATADNGRDLFTSDCASTVENPADDVDAFTTGFAVFSELPY